MSADHEIPTIVSSRSVGIERPTGVVLWDLSEFSAGNRLLSTHSTGLMFQAHFDADQWAAFQAFVSGVQS